MSVNNQPETIGKYRFYPLARSPLTPLKKGGIRVCFCVPLKKGDLGDKSLLKVPLLKGDLGGSGFGYKRDIQIFSLVVDTNW